MSERLRVEDGGVRLERREDIAWALECVTPERIQSLEFCPRVDPSRELRAITPPPTLDRDRAMAPAHQHQHRQIEPFLRAFIKDLQVPFELAQRQAGLACLFRQLPELGRFEALPGQQLEPFAKRSDLDRNRPAILNDARDPPPQNPTERNLDGHERAKSRNRQQCGRYRECPRPRVKLLRLAIKPLRESLPGGL